jgi:TolB-like protein
MKTETTKKMFTSHHHSIQLRFCSFTLALVVLLLLSSCSTFNGTRLEGLLGTHRNLIDLAYTIAEDLEKQAYPPLTPRNPDQPILTTTFVSNNNLDETSKFSRILQEHLTSRFVQMGYTVREIKLRKNLQITPGHGETMLSRRLAELQPTQKAQAISVGTYSLTKDAIYISARLIDPDNSNIISSNDYIMALNDKTMAMFGAKMAEEEKVYPVEEPRPSFMTRLLY